MKVNVKLKNSNKENFEKQMGVRTNWKTVEELQPENN